MNAPAMLERFFGWLLQTTWQAAVIVILILLVQLLFRNRLSSAWRHGLWFLLLIRLVMPVAPPSVLSIFNLIRWSGSQPAVQVLPTTAASRLESPASVAPTRPAVDLRQARAVAVAPAEMSHDESPAAPIPVPVPPATASPPKRAVDWLGLGSLLWLLGASVLFLRLLSSNLLFERRLARGTVISEPRVMSVLDECRELLGVTARVLLLETDEVDSPAVHSLWRRRLLLPRGLRESLSREELRHVFLHELAHIKRRDPELNWVLSVLQMLHWFNPALWFAFARMRVDREMATDELAISRGHGTDRRAYGETVVKILEGLTRARVLPNLVGIGESKGQIRERIRAIARGSVGRRWRWAACLVALVLAGIALTNAREGNQTAGTDLLSRYPTTLTNGDAVPGHARPWQFTQDDIFKVSHFSLEIGKRLRVEAGASDLGIGHCPDGAVWAVLIPTESGTLASEVSPQETVARIWLRFHPAEINRIFSPQTVSGRGDAGLEEQMLAIARAKFYSSWHAGDNAMIPEPKDLTVDVDTRGGPRRFFVVDTDAKTAEYVPAFAAQPFVPNSPPALEREPDPNCAQVVSVTPSDGARQVESSQELRIRFNRPMDPHFLKLQWLAGGFQLNGTIRVSADKTEFVIPLRLTPGEQQTLVLNRDAEWERWELMGRRPELKPSRSARAKEGFLGADSAPANEFRWSFSTKPASVKPGAPKPVLVKASPASGSTAPLLSLVELTFNQPMRATRAQLPYLQQSRPMEGPSIIPSFDYDAATHRFTFPALLRPDDDVRLTLRGFYGADGTPCEPIVLHYQTGPDNLDAEYTKRARAAAQDPGLQALLGSMKEARARYHSGIETVQTINLSLAKTSFNSIEAQTATFKWQGADQIYADISGPMSMKAFILGDDGRNCWLYSIDEKSEQRLDTTPARSTERYVSLLDPFDLGPHSVSEVLRGRELVPATDAELEGRRCHRVEQWDVRQDHFVYATKTEWWIDAESFLPRQIVQYSPNGCQIVGFEYSHLNESLPDSAFQPPSDSGENAHPLFFTKDPEAGETRFLKISDGANGRMSGRLGWHGASGTTSSGLN